MPFEEPCSSGITLDNQPATLCATIRSLLWIWIWLGHGANVMVLEDDEQKYVLVHSCHEACLVSVVAGAWGAVLTAGVVRRHFRMRGVERGRDSGVCGGRAGTSGAGRGCLEGCFWGVWPAAGCHQ